jgi:hypothetical protein
MHVQPINVKIKYTIEILENYKRGKKKTTHSKVSTEESGAEKTV